MLKQHSHSFALAAALVFGLSAFSSAHAAHVDASSPLLLAKNEQQGPEGNERLQKNLEIWRSLSPEQQARIKARREAFEKLSPEEKQRLREEFRAQHGGRG